MHALNVKYPTYANSTFSTIAGKENCILPKYSVLSWNTALYRGCAQYPPFYINQYRETYQRSEYSIYDNVCLKNCCSFVSLGLQTQRISMFILK